MNDIKEQVREFEKSLIIQYLQMQKGMVNQTSKQSGMPKKTLLRKMKEYKLNYKDYK